MGPGGRALLDGVGVVHEIVGDHLFAGDYFSAGPGLAGERLTLVKNHIAFCVRVSEGVSALRESSASNTRFGALIILEPIDHKPSVEGHDVCRRDSAQSCLGHFHPVQYLAAIIGRFSTALAFPPSRFFPAVLVLGVRWL